MWVKSGAIISGVSAAGGSSSRSVRGGNAMAKVHANAPSGKRQRILARLAILLAIFGGYLAVTKRVAVVKAFPGTAIIFQSAGLPVNIYQAEFQNVRARLAATGEDRQLLVEGEIRNLKAGKNEIPDVQLALIGEDGASVFSWIAKLPQKSLKSGENLTFKASLDMPPSGQHRVAVNFAR